MYKITATVYTDSTEIEKEGTEIIRCEEKVDSEPELQEIVKYHWGLDADEYELTILGEKENEVYEAICDVAKSNTDFDIGFDHLFGFMAENPSSDTTKGFIEYHLEEMHAPTTPDGKPEFTYLIGKDFVAEHWVSEEDMATFNEYLKKREA